MVAANDAPQPQRALELALAGEALHTLSIDIVATGVGPVPEHFSHPEREHCDR